MTKNILITGASGLVGSGVVDNLSRVYNIQGLGRRKFPTHPGSENLASYARCDISDSKELEAVVAESPADIILHFATAANVDFAERFRNSGENSPVWKVNVEATEVLAKLADKYGKRIIYASSAYVFDGKRGPYTEDDDPSDNDRSIMSYYAVMKWEGEKRITNNCDKWAIIRFETPIRADDYPKSDFARGLLKKWQDGNELAMTTNQTITPVLIQDVAKTVRLIIEKREAGIFHVGSEPTTPYDFLTNLAIKIYGNSRGINKAMYLVPKPTSGIPPRPLKGGVLMRRLVKLGMDTKTRTQMVEEFAGNFESPSELK